MAAFNIFHTIKTVESNYKYQTVMKYSKNIPAFGDNCHWRRKWQPTAVFLPGEFHGQSSLAVYCLWGHKELVTTEQVTLLLVQASFSYKIQACLSQESGSYVFEI